MSISGHLPDYEAEEEAVAQKAAADRLATLEEECAKKDEELKTLAESLQAAQKKVDEFSGGDKILEAEKKAGNENEDV